MDQLVASALPSQFLFPDEIVWEPVLDVDRYSKPVYGAATSIFCRVTRATKLVCNMQGQEELSGTQAILNGVYGVKPEDRITLADTSQPSIITVYRWTTALPHETLMMS